MLNMRKRLPNLWVNALWIVLEILFMAITWYLRRLLLGLWDFFSPSVIFIEVYFYKLESYYYFICRILFFKWGFIIWLENITHFYTTGILFEKECGIFWLSIYSDDEESDIKRIFFDITSLVYTGYSLWWIIWIYSSEVAPFPQFHLYFPLAFTFFYKKWPYINASFYVRQNNSPPCRSGSYFTQTYKSSKFEHV